MLAISCDGERGLGRGFEQQIVDHRLVLIGDVGDGCRQCVHHMKVRHRQQFGLALGQPLAGSSPLTLGAVSVAAAVVGDDGVSALLVLAACDMAAERGCAAALDRTHDLDLAKAHMAGVDAPPHCPVVAEDIRDLQSWSSHGRRRYGAGGSALSRFARRRRGARRPSRGLSILAISPIATRL